MPVELVRAGEQPEDGSPLQRVRVRTGRRSGSETRGEEEVLRPWVPHSPVPYPPDGPRTRPASQTKQGQTTGNGNATEAAGDLTEQTAVLHDGCRSAHCPVSALPTIPLSIRIYEGGPRVTPIAMIQERLPYLVEAVRVRDVFQSVAVVVVSRLDLYMAPA